MNIKELNQKGIFPAPDQSEEVFFKKVKALQEFPLHPSHVRLEDFDLDCDWVPIIIGNKGLKIWEAAALWQESVDSGFSLPKIQISTRLYGLCSKEELIAHEMVHAARVDFKEDRFEEVLAYATSSKAWRRYWGPFFQKPIEPLLLMGSIALTVLLQMLSVMGEFPSGYLLFPWLPVSLIGLGWIRLQRTHRLFNKCLRQVCLVIRDPKKGKAFLMRMSDQEIASFAQMPPPKIRKFVQEAQERCLRWKILCENYLTCG